MHPIVLSLGGNALIKHKQKGKYAEQHRNIRATAKEIAKAIKRGYFFVLTHGNGPQVGNLQIQMESAREKVPAMPLDVDGAMTQAQIGYMLQQELKCFLPKKEIATIVTETLVSKNDKSFKNPSKPIGPFYSKAKAMQLAKDGSVYHDDAGRGWRKFVASPKPIEILQLPTIKKLIAKKCIVICCGGGGIPVVKTRAGIEGVEAVIDKDRATQLLANSLKAERMIILTDVDFVFINYKQKNQKKLEKVSVAHLKKYLAQNQFARGSMYPKIESAIKFIEKGGKKVVITSLLHLNDALEKDYGTVVTKK